MMTKYRTSENTEPLVKELNKKSKGLHILILKNSFIIKNIITRFHTNFFPDLIMFII